VFAHERSEGDRSLILVSNSCTGESLERKHGKTIMENVRYAGIDVAKDKCDFALEDGTRAIFDQTAVGFCKAIAWLTHHRVTHVVLEPSGGYEKRLAEALTQAGLSVCRVSPHQARAFAKAKGVLAKTDAIDARLLAAFGRVLEPQPRQPSDAPTGALAEMVRRRRQIVGYLTEEHTRREQTQASAVAAMIDAHIAMLKSQLALIDKSISEKIVATPAMAEKQAVLQDVPGVGHVTAAVLLAEMPELGALDAKQAAALAGLAPYNRDSGKSSKKASVHGGRPGVRCALYMASVSAVRHNADIRAFYRRLRGQGKPAKVALIAAARKLIVILNAKLRDANPKNLAPAS
jgi:transposase